MEKSLLGKVAMVTGGSRGLGAVTAQALADQGADVAASYVASAEKAEDVVGKLRAKGFRALAIRSDQADMSAAKPLDDEVLAYYSKLDILVNNAATPCRVRPLTPPNLMSRASTGNGRSTF